MLRRTSNARIFLVLLWHRWLYIRRNKGQFFAVIILPFILTLLGFAISFPLIRIVEQVGNSIGPEVSTWGPTTLPSAGPLYYQENSWMSDDSDVSAFRPTILREGYGYGQGRDKCHYSRFYKCGDIDSTRYHLQLLTNRYVLYYPRSAVAESVMEGVRNRVKNTTDNFKNMDEKQLNNTLLDLSINESMSKLAASEVCTVFFAVKRCLIDPTERFRGFDSKSDAMDFATKNNLTTLRNKFAPLFAIVEFNGDDVSRLEYTIIYDRKLQNSVGKQLIHLQDLIDTSILQLQHVQDSSNDDLAGLAKSFNNMPVKCRHTYPLLYPILGFVLPMLLGLSFYFAPSALAQHLVVEKTLRLREYLAILGISSMQQKIAWMFFYFLTLVPITMVCSILMTFYAGNAFGNTSLGIIFLMFLLYSLSLLSFSLLLSSILTQSDNTGLLYFGYMTFSYLLSAPFTTALDLNGNTLISANILSFFCPYFNFRLCLTYIIDWQVTGLGCNFDNVFSSPYDTDDYGGIGMALVYLVLNSVTFVIMSWYIENAHPGEYGMKQPYYFPFLKSYWFPNSDKTGFSFDSTVSQQTAVLDRGIMLSKLTKEFESGILAVNNLTVQFAKGQITALLGENGAGKTTTMSMIVGVLEPTSGSIYIGGEQMSRGYDSVSAGIGYVPQYDILYPSITVQDHINFYAKILGLSRLEVQGRTADMMDKFGLEVVLQSKATTLSGGQKRKFSLMCALLGSPQCVVLDEPTSGVDPFSRRQIWDAILSHRSQSNSTIIVSTHQLDEAEVLSDDIAIVSCGELRCFGQPIDLKDEFCLGYKLYITSVPGNECNEESIGSLVTSKIPMALLHKSSGIDMIFSIPRADAQGENIVELLRQLEKSEAELGIAQFGVAEPTMDEVFFNAIPREKDVDEVHWSSGHTADVPVAKNSTFNSLLLCFVGLIEKRFFYFIRSKGNAVVQFIIPLLLLVLLFASSMWSSRLFLTDLSTGPTIQDIYVRHTYYDNTWFVDLNPEHGQLTESMKTILVTASQTGFGPVCGGSKKPSCIWKYGDAESLPDWPAQPIESSCPCNKPCKNEQLKRIDTMRTAAGDVILGAYAANLSGWMFAANDTLDGFIYGGFSMLENNATDRVQLFSDRLNLTSPVPSASLVLWASVEKRAAILNGLNNVILRAMTNNDAFIKYSVMADNLLVKNKYYNEYIHDVPSIIVLLIRTAPAVLISVTIFAYLSLAPIRYLLYEKETGVKDFQLSYGVQYFMYMLSNVAFDFLSTILIVSVVLMILASVPNPLTNFIPLIIFVVIPYTFAVIPYCTFLSIIFRRFKCAIIWITAEIIVFTVVGLPMCYFAFIDGCPELRDEIQNSTGRYTYCFDRIEENSNLETAVNVMKTLDFILPLFPLCGMSNGIYSAFIYYMYAYAAHFVNQDDEGGEAMKAIGAKIYETKFLGKYWLLSLVSAVMFTMLSVLIEMFFKNHCGSIFSRKPANLAIQTATQDPDVTVEEERVDRLQSVKGHPLVAKRLTKFYKKTPTPAVNQVSFAVDKKQCFGLLGANGAGKTTTFKMLTSSIYPSSGTSSVMGYNTTSRVARLTGYCPQENVLLDELTVRENLNVFTRMAGLRSTGLLINTIMEELGLTKYSGKRAGRLSGGNKRKLQMALALMDFRPVIFLDEPTTGLDPGSRRSAWRLIDSAVKKRSCAVVLTSHSMQECEELCSRLGIMVLGRLQCLGSVQYLKDKLGNRYTFKFRMPPGSAQLAADVKNYIALAFEGCATLSDVHETLLEFEIPRASLARLSYLFEVVLAVKCKFNLTSFSVSQATLEDVFIKYAERQLVPQVEPRTSDVPVVTRHYSSSEEAVPLLHPSDSVQNSV